MTGELMPRLARLTKVHGLILDGNDLAIQCATNTVDRADLKIPTVEALKLSEWLSQLPYSITLDPNEYSVTYEYMPLLAQLTKANGMVQYGAEVVVQCDTAAVEWTDISIPIEEALRLRATLSTLLSSFARPKKTGVGWREHVLRFPRPVSLEAVLEIRRFLYRANRYMQALSREELEQRLHDVWANVITLRDDGKYTLITPRRMPSPTRNIDFLTLQTELTEEFLIRGLLDGEQSTNPPPRIKRLDDESWCRRSDWVEASQHSRDSYFNKPKMFFKFGKAEYMRALYERGEVFVKPASSFAVADAAARQDDELTIRWYREGQKMEFTTSDYYCWCCASVYDYRLFWDFRSDGNPADACVAIHDPDRFFERLAAAVSAQVLDVARVRLVPAYYFDPLSVSDDPAEFAAYQDEAIQCAKHFRFAYQWEFRVIIIRSAPPPLQPFKVAMGSLRDIAELIVAPASLK